MANDEPPYLTVGTDVSAKYKGAFCEAKIKKVNRVVKCKVTFKNNLGSFMVTDDLIKGSLRMGADIEAKHPEKNQFLEAIINKLQDYSQYTVVFDDGDETTLRRTSLCLKSGRHFAESPTLDQFPLTNPEHFGTPVIGAGKYKRKRRSTMNSSLDYESSDDDPFPRKLKAIRGKERDPDLGKVVAVDYGDRRKKDSWYPGLIVPHPAQSNIKISKEEHLIRSFKDGKYYQVPKRDTREFSKESLPKIENNALKTAVDKAILYLEKEELPAHWDKALFMGLELPSADEDSQDSDSDSSDDEPSEDKDRFVAQLYKFMDERGTPINKAPTVSNKDLNLYKFFKIMHKLGGFNKVTNQNKWKTVYSKMGLPQSNANGPNQIKCAYKRYLQSFEDFYRKLGCTMVNNSRSTRGRHRSDRNFIITRTRERETASPKSRNSKDSKDKGTPDKKVEEKPRASDKKEIKVEDSPKPEDKPKSPEKKKIEKPRPDEKDEKKKKDERPRLARSQSLNKEKKESSPKEEEKKDVKPEKARTREDARKEKNESPEKKGTRSSLKIESEKKEKEESSKDKKDQSPKVKEKKEEKPVKDIKEEKSKEKKEEKAVKDRKIVNKDKKIEEKSMKDRIESSVKEKKEDKLLKEKRDSSKEPKEDKSTKGRKDDAKNSSEEKSPMKKKLERVAKEKKEEKSVRPRRENKSPMPENKKNMDESEIKGTAVEEKIKSDSDIKKEDTAAKEKSGPKLRERREDTPCSGVDDVGADVSDKDAASQDELDKKGPGARSKEEPDEPPNKSKRKSLKSNDKEDIADNTLSDSDDDTFTSEQDKDYKDLKNCEIELGDRVKVKYGRGRLKKVYDAKVLKIQSDGSEKRYFVHYNGWNNRYDEWVKRNFIVALVNSNKQKPETAQKSPMHSAKRVDRGRPPGPIVSKPARKNSTSSTNSSVSCSRATRSDKKNLPSSPLSSGLEQKKRPRKKSGVSLGLTDTSQDSDSDMEEINDLDDEDVGDADVEDNANTLNDSCFKEELFSDDEEKEKLEDVKRDDIKELEKAISVEETPEDGKDPFFSSVKKEVIKTEATDHSESSDLQDKSKIPVEASADVSKNEKAEVTVEKEKIEPCIVQQTLTTIKSEEETQILQTPEKVPELEKKPTISESSVIANINKNLIKPAKIISNLNTPSEIKIEKPIFSAVPSKMTSLLNTEQNKKDTLKSSLASSSLSLTENRNLSFSGLHGLIQINPFDKNIRNNAKDANTKNELPKTSISNSPPKIDLKPEIESKSFTSSLFRTDKMMPLFGANCILSPPKLSEPLKNEENPIIKSNIFGFSLKSNDDKEKSKDLKILDSPFKLSSKDITKEKCNVKSEDCKINKPFELPERRTESMPFKNSFLSPGKFSIGKTEIIEQKREKPKDSFDLLVENSNLSTPKKSNEIKDIFSLSFANLASKEKLNRDQTFNKVLPLSSDNLCVIKPKPTETFDLSKTIPSILERLKKDVVADLKVTDSPPPQKEELNFNFLRGSQDTVKSLSRSESSNSLRICEDMSDTNDSNTNSKDLIINEKFDSPSMVSSTASDNAVPCENITSQSNSSKDTETLSESIHSSENISENKEDTKSSLKTSVITVASTKLLPIPPVVTSDDKKNQPKECPPSKTLDVSKDVEKKIEFPLMKDNSAPKIDLSLEVQETKDTESSISQNEKKNGENIIKTDTEKISVNSSKSEKSTEHMMEKPTASVNIEKSETIIEVEKPVNISKGENPVNYDCIVENPANATKIEKPVPNSKIEKTSNSSKIEKSINITKVEKPVNVIKNETSIGTTKIEKSVSSKCEKDSLFDDLLKIKNTNTNFSQGSVIKWNTETKVNVIAEEETSAVLEAKDSPVKEQDLQSPDKKLSVESKDSETSDVPAAKKSCAEKAEEDLESKATNDLKSEPEDHENIGEDTTTSIFMTKKENKKKRLGKKFKKFGISDGFEKDDKEMKVKDGKSKSKRRRLENEDSERSKDPDKSKSKKIKKNKNKKRLAKHEDGTGEHKRADMEDDHKEVSEKIKRKEKRKSDKKFLKSGMKGEYSESKLELKKKKGKKNRDKLSGDKKDFLEKKTKKKKKPHIEENQDTDSDKETPHKSVEKKKKKDRKKFKTKDSSSSDDAGDKFFKDQSKSLSALPSSSSALLRQDSKSDDPDMSFLLCEEKVPASPVGIGNMGEDTSGSSSIESNRIDPAMDILPLPGVYPCIGNMESDSVNKHNIDTSAVLDNTPPTTPSSTESLLSSSPSHERDSFSMNYPESTQSGRDSGEGESDIFRCNPNRTIVRGSDEYHAATTLAFAVCKSVTDKPKEEPSHNFLKRQKSEVEEHSPSKRKKKSKRVRRSSESAKSPRHKSSLSRLSKIESCCEDSSGASPATSNSPPYSNTSTMNFSRSPHRLSCTSDGFSRYNFYVPLHEKDPEKRIALLQEKMAALRKEYMALRAKVIAIDHKRRRARKKIREAGAGNVNPSAQSEDGQSCS